MKCGETYLGFHMYGQMSCEGMPRNRAIPMTLNEILIRLGRVSNVLAALGEQHAVGEPPDTHLYNLVLIAATKLGPPHLVLTMYHRCNPCSMPAANYFFLCCKPASCCETNDQKVINPS